MMMCQSDMVKDAMKYFAQDQLRPGHDLSVCMAPGLAAFYASGLLQNSLVDTMGTTLGIKTNAVDKYMNTVVHVHEKAQSGLFVCAS